MSAQTRLVERGIDQEGSFEKAWQVLMTRQESPKLELHSRTWAIAETVNVCKQLHVDVVDSLSRLLLAYFLPATGEPIEAFPYEKVLLQIHVELDGLGDLW